MVSTINDAVFQRRNNQIQDAIDAQNLKQALQLIEKRMKKGEDTRFLKVGCFRPCGYVFRLFAVHTIAMETRCLLFISLIVSLNRHGEPISSSAMPTKPITSVE